MPMFLDRVRATINRSSLIAPRDRIIAGVSGGPDSTALLLVLKALSAQYKLTLHAAHVDHMLRKTSKRDARFVKDLCAKLDIPVTIRKIDIMRRSTGRSIEETARDERFAFFCTLAKKHKADTIALGHNLDDQAETVLMRLLRGSGLYGLSAIMPKRIINGHTVIRPLLDVRRREIDAFLRRRRITPCIDESNREDIYLRNRLRHHLLPLLEKNYNRNMTAILSNTARAAADDYDYLINAAQRTAAALGNRIPLAKIKALHPAMRRLVLRLNFQRLKGDTRTLAFRHILELEDLISSRPQNSIVDLPSGISVVKRGTSLRFYKR
ncbi:MAG TPA: tRNA lysidine(34) synthetase TilS [Candidatus Omnitrophota bacterium]|nr:tRNA lysidine(34) synthetase TilS [Candidatus Omnitrophota bacterium]